jgi:menaquinone-dependent protoporphyrinogen IX oxidase
MIHTLIVYGTRKGTTENTAYVIGETLILKHGHSVELTNVAKIRKFRHRLDEFDLIIVGSSIISGRWVWRALRFLRKHEFLNQKVALFITAGNTLNREKELGLRKEDLIKEAISKYIDKYLTEFKFTPIAKIAFGGLIIRYGKEKLNSWNREDIESWAIGIGKLVGKKNSK